MGKGRPRVQIPHTGSVSLWESGLTIVHPFYNDFERLVLQREAWGEYSEQLRKAVKFILIDDCSSLPLHKEFERNPIDLDITIYRIKEDLKWNTPGAHNLGMLNATTPWAINMASDFAIEADHLTRLMDMKPDKDYFYKMIRNRITNDPTVKLRLKEPHPEVFLHSIDSFKDVGCFDEDFTGERSGGYGIFDNWFSAVLLRCEYEIVIIEGVKVTEWYDDIVDGGPNISTVIDRDTIKLNKILFRAKEKSWKRREHLPTLRFEWEQTYG